jgi:uncharacterized protein with NAD-binding domain and iron-sulfur cluster
MAPSVIVLGGGIGGMSAAHELCERGFDVRVYEQRGVPGGKARSVVVPSTVPRPNVGTVHLGRAAAPTRRDLPGEHGFRFFPRFYRHIIDTMQHTPYRGSRSVADNLVNTAEVVLARFDRRALKFPTVPPMSPVEWLHLLNDLGSLFGPEFGIAPDEYAFFGDRVWQIMTSCSERRMAEYEKMGWWEFIGAADRSENYQKLFGIGMTRSVVAAQAKRASAKTIGDMFVQYFFSSNDALQSNDRVLNGPTNDVWLDPWLAYLRSRGVEYYLNATVRSLDVRGGSVSGVVVDQGGVLSAEHADYYVSALPIEVMSQLVTDQVVRADPELAKIFPLSRNTAWMNGIQFYLDEDVRIGRGHEIYLDSPWALTSISQKQFWPDVDLSRYADGSIRGVISVDISDWETPGLNGKPARECSRTEIRDEVWQQLKRSLNVERADLLEDEDLRYWYLDLDVDPLLKSDAEPLLVNLADTWRLRPQAVTGIPNFFLASDYVRTYTDLATMEGANEAARRAVNGILAQSGVSAPPCRLWNLHEPEVLEPWRAHDLTRYRQGLPWDGTLVRLALSAVAALQRGANLVEAEIRSAVSRVSRSEDLLTYLRTGENRSALIERLGAPAPIGVEDSADLLRAFVELAGSLSGNPSDARASWTQNMLTSAADAASGSGVRFLQP